MKIKILDTFAVPVSLYDILKSLGTVSLFTDVVSDTDILLKRAQGGDVIVVNKTPVTAEVIQGLDSTVLIAETASGYDNIDTEAAAANTIAVCNVPGYSTPSVAEHVFAMLFAASRKIRQCREQTNSGEWIDESLLGTELNGSSMGIVGFGAIGRSVCRTALALGMQVSVHTGNPGKYREKYPDIPFVSLEQIIRESDIVTLHIPHTDETCRLISRDLLEAMKPGAVLVNTSRGGVVDEQALTDVCRQGRITACLDVLSSEPPAPENELLSLPGVLVTPHIAWYTLSAVERLIQETRDNIVSFFSGSPRNIVP